MSGPPGARPAARSIRSWSISPSDPSIRVVGINQKDNPDNARRFLGTLGNPYAAVGVDPNGRASIDWGVYGVPETFIVGPDGTIRHKHIGPLTPENFGAFKERLRQIPRA